MIDAVPVGRGIDTDAWIMEPHVISSGRGYITDEEMRQACDVAGHTKPEIMLTAMQKILFFFRDRHGLRLIREEQTSYRDELEHMTVYEVRQLVERQNGKAYTEVWK
jgi:hypothetical protein